MPTTIRLTDELRSRLAAAAERQGMTAHAYMLAALEEKAAEAEAEAAFLQEAQARWAQFLKDGKSYTLEEFEALVDADLQALDIGAGAPEPTRPRARQRA